MTDDNADPFPTKAVSPEEEIIPQFDGNDSVIDEVIPNGWIDKNRAQPDVRTEQGPLGSDHNDDPLTTKVVSPEVPQHESIPEDVCNTIPVIVTNINMKDASPRSPEKTLVKNNCSNKLSEASQLPV